MNEHSRDTTTSELSRTFRKIFREAEVVDLHFHDLRHEAACRLYERTKLSDVLIAKSPGIGISECYNAMRVCEEAIWRFTFGKCRLLE